MFRLTSFVIDDNGRDRGMGHGTSSHPLGARQHLVAVHTARAARRDLDTAGVA